MTCNRADYCMWMKLIGLFFAPHFHNTGMDGCCTQNYNLPPFEFFTRLIRRHHLQYDLWPTKTKGPHTRQWRGESPPLNMQSRYEQATTQATTNRRQVWSALFLLRAVLNISAANEALNVAWINSQINEFHNCHFAMANYRRMIFCAWAMFFARLYSRMLQAWPMNDKSQPLWLLFACNLNPYLSNNGASGHTLSESTSILYKWFGFLGRCCLICFCCVRVVFMNEF